MTEYATKSEFARAVVPYFQKIRGMATRLGANGADMLVADASYLLTPTFLKPLFTRMGWESRELPREVCWAKELLEEQGDTTTSIQIQYNYLLASYTPFLRVVLTAHWGPGKVLSSCIVRVRCFGDYHPREIARHRIEFQ